MLVNLFPTIGLNYVLSLHITLNKIIAAEKFHACGFHGLISHFDCSYLVFPVLYHIIRWN